MVEAWVAANHDSVRLCPSEREVEVEVSLTSSQQLALMISIVISRLIGMNKSGFC